MKKRGGKNDPGQMLLFADVVSNGNGGFTVTPKKPLMEIEARQVAKILGLSQRQVANIVNHPEGGRILRWRWSSEKQGKRLFEYESVMEYREATKDPEFGEAQRATTNGHE